MPLEFQSICTITPGTEKLASAASLTPYIHFSSRLSLTVAVFIDPEGVSPWHNAELRTAIDRAVQRAMSIE